MSEQRRDISSVVMSQIENRDIEEARDYHGATKHSNWSVRSGGHFLDWETKPSLFKLYPTLKRDTVAS